jgi:ring-1,2-phenylacetyl-CoA epoxidase subunit PaaD
MTTQGRKTCSEATIWEALKEVMDPEIPVLSLVDLGVVREVKVTDAGVTVVMTPTFAGCPALEVMRRQVEEKLREMAAPNPRVEMVLEPAWTSDYITPEGRRKLESFGLAPPPVHGGDVAIMLNPAVRCPYCGSLQTRVTNTFGSTLCRAIYYCDGCQQAFEQFKPL